MGGGSQINNPLPGGPGGTDSQSPSAVRGWTSKQTRTGPIHETGAGRDETHTSIIPKPSRLGTYTGRGLPGRHSGLVYRLGVYRVAEETQYIPNPFEGNGPEDHRYHS